MQQDEPAGSRLFVVCGKSVEESVLGEAFSAYGNVQHVRHIKEKGVAYVKYDKASSAAVAIENLHQAVLNNGKGPKLKVLLAEAPPSKSHMIKAPPTPELSTDPDNTPPRSRLFLVVPKTAEAKVFEDFFAKYEGLESVKTDLISSKGVVFSKFHKASLALKALEDVQDTSMVGSYKVKIMLAEPKTKRARPGSISPPDGYHAGKLDFAMMAQLDPTLKLGPAHLMGLPGFGFGAGLGAVGMSLPEYAHLGGLPYNGFSVGSSMDSLAQQQLGYGLGAMSAGSLSGGSPSAAPLSPSSSNAPLSRQRLFIVVHKNVGQEDLARLFRRFPGMEYCDLKKDRATGKSKGYAYVNFSTPEAAALAIEQLHGTEFPPHSGSRIKVMYAEQLGPRPMVPPPLAMHSPMHPALPQPLVSAGPSPVRTPLPHGLGSAADVVAVRDSLASMSLPRLDPTVVQNGGTTPLHDLNRRMSTPAATSGVARELMFNVG